MWQNKEHFLLIQGGPVFTVITILNGATVVLDTAVSCCTNKRIRGLAKLPFTSFIMEDIVSTRKVYLIRIHGPSYNQVYPRDIHQTKTI